MTLHRLPDGSGSLVATVGARGPGLLAALKYHRGGYARGWLILWRNYRSAYVMSRWRDLGPPMSRWRALRWSWAVHPGVWP